MPTANDLIRIKQHADAERAERDKATGALGEVLRRLKEFGCSSVAEAKIKLKQLERDARAADEKFAAELRGFEREHGDNTDA